MPNFIENLGLGFIYDDDETTTNFLGHLIQNGKAVNGYYGWPNIFNGMGNIDFYVKTKMNDDGKLEVVGLDTHCCGPNVWKMRHTGIDITPKNSLPTSGVFMFKNHTDGVGMVPIHIINADILPSFLEDDVVSMQMCAFPLDIKYYANEDDYANDQPKLKNGKQWLLADGSLIPVSFLHNHQVQNDDADYSTDDHVLFKGTVKCLEYGIFEMEEGNSVKTYIRCEIDTHFGRLQLAHTIDQINEEQRDNIEVGAVVFGSCVLSGDVAIDKYEWGFVKDFDNNFKLLRQVIVKGQAERMRPVLCDDAIYISDESGNSYKGIDKIINRFNEIHKAHSGKCFATPATITDTDDKNLEYPVGTRCLLISYEIEDDYSAIAFLDVSDEGNIKKIHISTDSRYHFKADEKIRDASILDDIIIPESVIEPIYMRAKFHCLIDEELSLEDLVKDVTDDSTWQNNVTNMLDALKENPQPDVEVALENLFGYLFAKAIEMTVNENKRVCFETTLIASYSPEDAFNGEIFSELDEGNHSKLVEAMELGKQFYKDFKFFTEMSETNEDIFIDNIMTSLVMVQHIGTLYADKLFNHLC